MPKYDIWAAQFPNVQVDIPSEWGPNRATHMAFGRIAQHTLRELGLTRYGVVRVSVVAEATVPVGELRARTEGDTAVVAVHPSQRGELCDLAKAVDETAQTIAGVAVMAAHQRRTGRSTTADELATMYHLAVGIAGDEIKRIKRKVKSESDSF